MVLLGAIEVPGQEPTEHSSHLRTPLREKSKVPRRILAREVFIHTLPFSSRVSLQKYIQQGKIMRGLIKRQRERLVERKVGRNYLVLIHRSPLPGWPTPGGDHLEESVGKPTWVVSQAKLQKHRFLLGSLSSNGGGSQAEDVLPGVFVESSQ